MNIISTVCNCCGKPIPIDKVAILGKTIYKLRLGKLDFGYNVSNDLLSSMDIHICESCAEKFNTLMKLTKYEMLMKIGY